MGKKDDKNNAHLLTAKTQYNTQQITLLNLPSTSLYGNLCLLERKLCPQHKKAVETKYNERQLSVALSHKREYAWYSR